VLCECVHFVGLHSGCENVCGTCSLEDEDDDDDYDDDVFVVEGTSEEKG
jgi:hypothetical protein